MDVIDQVYEEYLEQENEGRRVSDTLGCGGVSILEWMWLVGTDPHKKKKDHDHDSKYHDGKHRDGNHHERQTRGSSRPPSVSTPNPSNPQSPAPVKTPQSSARPSTAHTCRPGTTPVRAPTAHSGTSYPAPNTPLAIKAAHSLQIQQHNPATMPSHRSKRISRGGTGINVGKCISLLHLRCFGCTRNVCLE